MGSWPDPRSVTSFRTKSNTQIYLGKFCLLLLVKKMGQTRSVFVYFCSFHMTNIAQILFMIKVLMVCLGLEPRAAGWLVQMNQLSNGGTPLLLLPSMRSTGIAIFYAEIVQQIR